MEEEKYKYKFVLNTGQMAYADNREELDKALLSGVKIVSQEKIHG